ncbi:aldo/keto reductase [Microbulbifer agarilyticus]|uniref:aldo/keto reductase n=1 Tax=Microbulbifer agarilyticus TaxID=260552 RepID=UPI001C97C030|nr:aldo/keto reductase [Microbulbifer agarilyticus]MBY6210347.1 aldo/keto reductase [Microbulbifer agarilyticus]
MSANREIGKTGLKVPPICFGSTGLGSIPDLYGYEVDEARALDTIRAILERPDGFIDTARVYAMGRSEERIGKVVSELGGWPEGRVLATKLDMDGESRVFDGHQARKSFEQSLEALCVDRVDILYVHDVEYAANLSDVTREGGALDVLFKLKEEGLATAVGLAAGNIDVMMPIVRDRDFDALLTHNRHTLVNNNAAPMIELAKSKGISVLNAAPFGGGILSKGSSAQNHYAYREAEEKTLALVRAVEEVCVRHDVPLGAVALQSSLRDPDVTSTVCGVTWPEHVRQAYEWADWPIDDAVWQELAKIKPSAANPEAATG